MHAVAPTPLRAPSCNPLGPQHTSVDHAARNRAVFYVKWQKILMDGPDHGLWDFPTCLSRFEGMLMPLLGCCSKTHCHEGFYSDVDTACIRRPAQWSMHTAAVRTQGIAIRHSPIC
eukprot:550886-Pelagomonas_calceolata.AAC.2